MSELTATETRILEFLRQDEQAKAAAAAALVADLAANLSQDEQDQRDYHASALAAAKLAGNATEYTACRQLALAARRLTCNGLIFDALEHASERDTAALRYLGTVLYVLLGEGSGARADLTAKGL